MRICLIIAGHWPMTHSAVCAGNPNQSSRFQLGQRDREGCDNPQIASAKQNRAKRHARPDRTTAGGKC